MKNMGVLTFMIVGEAVGLIFGAVAGISFLVGVGIAEAIAGQSSDYFECTRWYFSNYVNFQSGTRRISLKHIK